MSVRRVRADPRVQANHGRVALQRGPLVYCVEGVDQGGRVFHLSLPLDAKLVARHRCDLLGGVTVIEGTALASYGSPTADHIVTTLVDFQAVPFYAWDNRQPGPMNVWIPETTDLAEPIETPSLQPASRTNREMILDGKAVEGLPQ